MSMVIRSTMGLLCIAVAVYAIGTYAFLPVGAAVHPEIRPAFLERPAVVLTHVFAAALALLSGPMQFSSWLRRTLPSLHRWLGRLYCCCVLAGGISGLVLAVHAYSGLTARMGFGALAIVWLYTGLRAFSSILAGDIAAHRDWMTRNFALTSAAVTLRLYMAVLLASGLSLDMAYPVIAWLCWVPNLLAAQWYLARRRGRDQSDADSASLRASARVAGSGSTPISSRSRRASCL